MIGGKGGEGVWNINGKDCQRGGKGAGSKIPNFSATSFLNGPLNNMKFGPGDQINEKIVRWKKFSHELIMPNFYFIINFPNKTDWKPSADLVLTTFSTNQNLYLYLLEYYQKIDLCQHLEALSAIIYLLKVTIETLEKCVKHIQS